RSMEARAALHCSGVLRPRHRVSTLPKSNAGQSNVERTIAPLASWRARSANERSTRRGSPLVLQWRAHPAMADGYRSRLGTPGPPAFLLAVGRSNPTTSFQEFRRIAMPRTTPLDHYRNIGIMAH